MLVGRVCRGTDGLNDDEQGDFRAGKECVNQIFTLKQIGEKARKEYVGFMNLQKVYDRVNREASW